MEYVKNSRQLCWSPASTSLPSHSHRRVWPSCPVLRSFGRWPSLYHSRSVYHPIRQYARFAQACWPCDRPVFPRCMAVLNLMKLPFLVVKDYWDCLNVLAQSTSYEVTIQILNRLPVEYLKLHSQWDLSDVCRSKLPSHGKDLQRDGHHHGSVIYSLAQCLNIKPSSETGVTETTETHKPHNSHTFQSASNSMFV